MVVMGMKAATVENLDYLVGVAHSPQVGFGERFVPASYLLRTSNRYRTGAVQLLTKP